MSPYMRHRGICMTFCSVKPAKWTRYVVYSHHFSTRFSNFSSLVLCKELDKGVVCTKLSMSLPFFANGRFLALVLTITCLQNHVPEWAAIWDLWLSRCANTSVRFLCGESCKGCRHVCHLCSSSIRCLLKSHALALLLWLFCSCIAGNWRTI